ncbi:hypothetical protein [Micromonospora sp. LOL_023]|uniref:hypothetical protein n=1 Tax=Micromonospora sp. LOL_023 TaxID=3345418 RepID=UPI003A8613A5
MGKLYADIGGRLDEHRVAYLDCTGWHTWTNHGSGAETVAQLRASGRITLVFCAFDGPPKMPAFS